jgi:hypothetical protein
LRLISPDAVLPLRIFYKLYFATDLLLKRIGRDW